MCAHGGSKVEQDEQSSECGVRARIIWCCERESACKLGSALTSSTRTSLLNERRDGIAALHSGQLGFPTRSHCVHGQRVHVGSAAWLWTGASRPYSVTAGMVGDGK